MSRDRPGIEATSSPSVRASRLRVQVSPALPPSHKPDHRAAFGMFAQKDCYLQDGYPALSLLRPHAPFGEETCTIDRVTKLEDEHYLISNTCKSHLGPDRMHPTRGQPYEYAEILNLDSCGRLQSKTPEYCHPHCEDPPGSRIRIVTLRVLQKSSFN